MLVRTLSSINFLLVSESGITAVSAANIAFPRECVRATKVSAENQFLQQICENHCSVDTESLSPVRGGRATAVSAANLTPCECMRGTTVSAVNYSLPQMCEDQRSVDGESSSPRMCEESLHSRRTISLPGEWRKDYCGPDGQSTSPASGGRTTAVSAANLPPPRAGEGRGGGSSHLLK